MPSTLPDPRYTQLRTWYDQLTARVAAADKDIGRSVYEHERQLHRERLAELAADRELVTAYLDALEREQPLPGPWPPEFKTTDLLAPPPPRIIFKAGRCDFYHHIPLPPNFIPRPELLAEVRERLLAGTGGLALTSAIQVKQADVLHGMGGIGKSVLARALCDDPDVQAAFPDGILWATLGQTPDLTARLREWIETLGGVVGQTAPTLDQLRNTLAEALKGKACLLIVDDAWRKVHLEPFCAGGPACRLLITTRDAALAEGLDAGVCPVPVMTPERAVALLEEWAQGGLAEVEAEVKVRIVRRMGCLPLAVRLAGAQLRAKDPAQWLASFDARKLKTRRVEAVHDSLEATFGLSLDALDHADRRLYVALAIFKEDEPIAAVAITKLWSALDDRSPDKSEELLEDLAARALLVRSQGDSDAVTIHDLLRDFMAAELDQEGRIAAHCALLDAYRRIYQGDGWHTAPDDGYLYNHMAYHLDALADHYAVAEDELHGLFADQTWLHARVPQSGYLYDGYLNDLDIAFYRSHVAAHYQIAADQEPSALSNCVRYVLIGTSINSLAGSYDVSMVARAVTTGAWTAQRALGMSRLIPDPRRRAAAYTKLLGVEGLASDLRRRAEWDGLAAAQSIDHEGARANALVALASQLMGEAREVALQEALVATRAIRDADFRAELLATLAPQMTGEAQEAALREALAAVTKIRREWPWSGAKALKILAPQLTGELVLAGLAAAQVISDGWYRAEALRALTPKLTGQLVREGLAAAQAGDERCRAQALLSLAPALTGELAREALAAVQTIHDDWCRTRALEALAPQLTGTLLWDGIAATRVIRDERARAKALVALAPQLTGELVREALVVAQGIRDEGSCARALAALAPQLTGKAREAALQEALALAQGITNEGSRAGVLAALVPHLTGELLREALHAALAMSHEWPDEEILVGLAPQLTGELVREGLAAAAAISHERYRARALAALAPQLRGELVREALATMQAICSDWDREKALAALAPHLTGDLTREGLATQAIGDEEARVRALAALSSWLTGKVREVTLWEGLKAAQAIRYEKYRTQALAALAPQLTGELVREALAVARAICDRECRAQALVALAPQLIGEAREAVLQEGLMAAWALDDEWTRAEVLAILARQLTGAAREQALQAGLAAAQAIRDEETRAEVLAALASQLKGEAKEESLREGLAAAWLIDHESVRAKALATLAAQLTGELVREALAAAQAICDEGSRARVLAALAPQLSGELLWEGLTATQAISDVWHREQALVALVAQLRGESVQAGLTAVHAMRYEKYRTQALAALAPQLTGELVREALAVARAICDREYRVQALVALAPHLTGAARGQALQAGLAAARTIHDPGTRAYTLAAFLPHLPELDSAALLHAIRHAIADQLMRNIAFQKRKAVLDFCADSRIFAPPILSPATLAAIAGHIIEICQEWEWL